ncbi:hypothetical protein AB0I28_28915 [Phytomonospora sp. NPDC050363]|uniref:hypothetical protein n=1 Tax=Phytomonospora sp. NPDC050363 TaxID=3155642 RepID=UPI0033CDA8A3
MTDTAAEFTGFARRRLRQILHSVAEESRPVPLEEAAMAGDYRLEPVGSGLALWTDDIITHEIVDGSVHLSNHGEDTSRSWTTPELPELATSLLIGYSYPDDEILE